MTEARILLVAFVLGVDLAYLAWVLTEKARR